MRADADQLAMARLRHSLVARLAEDRRLLDVACGSGYALPLIAGRARSVTGCDYDETNIRDCRRALPSGTFLVADAERLPLRRNSFDVVVCLEAVYYFGDWRGFVRSARRLLAPGGTFVATWPNPARPAFDPSPHSTVYPSAEEMMNEADESGFTGECYGAFALDDLGTARRPLLDSVRRAAVSLRLIPRSLRLRMLLKRILYRRLEPLSRISLIADPDQHLVPVGAATANRFAMLYYVGDVSATAGADR